MSGFWGVAYWILALIAFSMLVAGIYCFVRYLLDSRKVDRFFSEHECLYGKLVRYEYEEEHSSTTYVPIRTGNITIVNPMTHHHPAVYKIILECQDQSMTFLATYEIPEEDYEVGEIGEFICIKEGWDPVAYEVTQEN